MLKLHNMPKIIFLIITLYLFTNQLIGQTTITGKLQSSSHESLAAVSVVAYDLSKQNILAYAFSDDAGTFRLSFKHSGKKIYISTKSISTRDTSILLDNKSQKIDVTLKEELNEIEEVQVEGYPISARGDTIIYTVKSFAQQKDNSIGDVIKRLPGFEVSSDGQISYQGEKIEKYYIEGLDLLEERYGIANRSLPHKSVSSVEVLQNHQPIKMLRDKTFTDATSINIRLGNKVAFTGTMYAAAGLSPFLYDVNLSPMLFTKKQQMIASLQLNNIGNDLSRQFKPVFSNIANLSALTNIKDNLVGISSIQLPEIDKERYLHNNAILLSYNHLLKISKDTELKINTSYYNDIVENKSKITSTFITPDNNMEIIETNENKYYNNSMYTNLFLEKNSEKGYLKNKLSFNGFWDEEKGITQHPKTFNQVANTAHQSLSNTLQLYLPIKHHFINIYSFIDYNSSPQSVSFMPGVLKKGLNNDIDYHTTTQNFTKENIITEHHVSFFYKMRYWSFSNKLGFNYENQNIETNIEIDNNKLQTDSLNNKLSWQYFELYFYEKIEYIKGDFRMSLLLPIKQLFYKINDTYDRSPANLQRTIITPYLYINKAISNYFNVRFRLRYQQSMQTPEQLMQGYLIKNYRKISKNSDKIPEKRGIGAFVGIEYKNPITGFFSNLSFNSKFTKRNLLNNYINQGNGVWYYDAVEKENKQEFHVLNLEIKQYISKLHTSLGLVTMLSNNQSDYLSNNNIKHNNTNGFTITPRISISQWRWIDIAYNYTYNIIHQKTSDNSLNFINQTHKGNISFNFSAQHQLSFTLDYYESSSDNERNSATLFNDIAYYYKPKKSKFRFRLNCNNIFNQKEYTKYYNSDIYMSKNVYQIRPQEFILTVYYNL